ncbi:unnamed protein product [Rotaria magnacalcarata]|uniref:Uncharacterized protein n=1 Tax=Rotaria magnacalcarata TaxID=392030 RepID=A0A819ZS36_9BILA|nr:unnamed protein product [Rotaria magnacalcarata]CAF4167512.1 unnamed protein product [Rotaria magnacalcarata]
MIFNYQYLNLYAFTLVTIFLSSSTVTLCNNLTLVDNKNTPFALEISIHNPIRLCQSSLGVFLDFKDIYIYTTSPTMIDAYPTAFLQYVLDSDNYLQDISEKAIKTPGNETTIRTESEARTASTKPDKIMAHDDLIPQQIEPLREKNSHEHSE